MNYQSSEAILLRAIPFRDFDAILTLLTPQGKIKVVKKGENRISPLTHVDVTFFVGRSDLYQCRSLTELNPFLSLRRNLATLEAACEMAKAVDAVAMPNQECPLFTHLLDCLETLGQARDPAAEIASLYLYILDAEGLLPPEKYWRTDDPQVQAHIKNLFYRLINK